MKSPIEDYGPDGMKATREFVVEWADRREFLNELLGTGAEFAGTPQSQYPDLKGVFAVRVNIRPFTSDVVQECHDDIELNLNSYKSLAVVTVQYDSVDPVKWPDPEILPPGEFNPGVWLSYRATGGVEAMVVEGRGLKWKATSPGDDATPIAEADIHLVQQIPITNHLLTFHRVHSPPFTAMRNFLGSVNSARDNPIKGIETETLLFAGWSLDREFIFPVDFDDPKAGWRLSYTFSEKRVTIAPNRIGGWNHLYRTTPKDEAGWARVQGRLSDPYPGVSDWDALFTSGASGD